MCRNGASCDLACETRLQEMRAPGKLAYLEHAQAAETAGRRLHTGRAEIGLIDLLNRLIDLLNVGAALATAGSAAASLPAAGLGRGPVFVRTGSRAAAESVAAVASRRPPSPVDVGTSRILSELDRQSTRS